MLTKQQRTLLVISLVGIVMGMAGSSYGIERAFGVPWVYTVCAEAIFAIISVGPVAVMRLVGWPKEYWRRVSEEARRIEAERAKARSTPG